MFVLPPELFQPGNTINLKLCIAATLHSYILQTKVKILSKIMTRHTQAYTPNIAYKFQDIFNNFSSLQFRHFAIKMCCCSIVTLL